MSCERMQSRILEYMDGRLKENERAEVQKHLDSCSACRVRATEFSAVSDLLDELPVIEPSPAFDVRVRALIAAEPVKQSWWAWLNVSPIEQRQVIAEQDLPVVENADYDVISSFAPLADLSQAPTDEDNGDANSNDNTSQQM